MANLSSYINTNVNITKDMTFGDIVKGVKKSISEQKNHMPGLAEGPYILLIFACLPWFLARHLFLWLIKTCGGNIPVLTNAGTMDITYIKADGVPAHDGYPIGPVMYPLKIDHRIGVNGSQHAVAAGFSEYHFKRENVENLFKNMEQTVIDAEAALK